MAGKAIGIHDRAWVCGAAEQSRALEGGPLRPTRRPLGAVCGELQGGDRPGAHGCGDVNAAAPACPPGLATSGGRRARRLHRVTWCATELTTASAEGFGARATLTKPHRMHQRGRWARVLGVSGGSHERCDTHLVGARAYHPHRSPLRTAGLPSPRIRRRALRPVPASGASVREAPRDVRLRAARSLQGRPRRRRAALGEVGAGGPPPGRGRR